MAGPLVLPETGDGMTEQSTTRSPEHGMIAQTDRVSRMLLATVQGIATQAALDQDHWSPHEQLSLLTLQVAAILRHASNA